MQGLRPLLPLGLALLMGCATPYPPVGEHSLPTVPGVSAIPDRASRRSAPSEDTTATTAQTGKEAERSRPVSQEVVPPPPDPATLPEAEKRQLDIRLASQRFNYFEDDQLVWTGLISSGTAQHPTPAGSYQVQAKDIDKHSGSYTNSFDRPTPMPYALQFRGPYWVHEGYATGEPESHGCVRLRHADAKFVYERIKVGDRIVVAD